ncbi:MAG: hypothetical protein ACRC7O_08010 [Fimbriiglobus sp.]
MPEITRQTLRDYLNDDLPDAELAAVEKALRDSPELRALFDGVRQESDRGEHSVGAVWRRERLTCPTRDQLGAFLLDALDPDFGDYIRFHLETVGCPVCQANHDDLVKLNAEPAPVARARQKRIVDSAAGVLRPNPKPGP